MTISEDSLVESGQVTGTHGLRGDIKVRPLSGDPQALLQAERFYLRLPDGQIHEATPLRQSLHKGALLLRFVGFESLTAVESLKGAKILLHRDSLPLLDEDEFYWHQIEGARVVDRQHGDIGLLKSMFTTAAHNTWVVEGVNGEVMIPVVDAFIIKIDPDQKRIEVDLPDGLIGADS